MTREEAIKGLETLSKYFSGYKPNEEMFEMAVSALKAQDATDTNVGSNGDTIYRQAAIDAECEVCRIAPRKERGHNCTYYVHGCKEIECLRALPSAQPESVRCKDCRHGVDYYHEGDCYCSNPKWGLTYFGGSWEFDCADAKPKEEP